MAIPINRVASSSALRATKLTNPLSYAVTDQQHPATSTRLKHAAESSLKHPEHDHVKREPGGPSPDERKLQNNFRTGAVEAAEREWYRPATRGSPARCSPRRP